MVPARVLVVDDEEPNRRLIRNCLAPAGYAIAEASSADEALSAIRQRVPDLILLDVMMPGTDGYQVARQLKTDPLTKLVPIVMVTALDQLEDKIKAIDLGADDYLVKPVRLPELRARVRSLVALKRYTDDLEHASKVVQSMALAVERRDAHTGNHCKRLGHYAGTVGSILRLDDEALSRLRLGGVLHDVGKIGISDLILNKPGKLTPEERTLIEQHPIIGDELCRPMQTLLSVLPLIRHHHEKLDGSGYPDGLKGSDISIEVRIITVVDVYDALATDRPYKKAFPRETCFEILRDGVTKGWWDGDVVETLAGALAKGPAT